MRFRVGIDRGGTFVDAIAIDRSGRLVEVKSLPNSSDGQKAVLNSLDELAQRFSLDRRTFLSQIDTLVHGTTESLEAIINRSGPCMGVIATKGHRDVLQLRRVRKDNMWDWRKPFPEPLVPRYLRVGVEERMDSKGNVVRPLDEESAHKAIAYLKKRGVRSIVVTLLFSFLNPAHEKRIRELVQQDFPAAEVTLSHEVLSISGEYERFNTTVLDAYVRPVMANYVKELKNLLSAEGFQGQLFMIQNNGGIESDQAALHKPSTLITASPAAGPAAALISNAGRRPDLLSVDIGGTSAQVALINAGQVSFRNESVIADHRFSLPIADIETMGSGGGSIVWFDVGNTIHVGPASAGANPGPVCYGLGGKDVTLTDALLVLGYLNPDYFLEGKRQLRKDLAEQAIAEKVAARLNVSLLEAAAIIYKVSNSVLASGILHTFTTKGLDPGDFILNVGGGAGPACAFRLAQELGMKQVIIPKYAAVYSSLGMLNTDIRHDFSRYYSSLAANVDLKKVRALYQEMETEADRLLEGEGIIHDQRTLMRTLRMKYYGQFRDLEVSWPSGPVTAQAIAKGIANFHHRHQELFGSSNEKYPLEFMKFGLTAIGKMPRVTVKRTPQGTSDPAAAFKGTRQVYFEENQGLVKTSIWDGTKLRSGHLLKGPAIVEERLTTIVIPPGFKVQIDAQGNYVTGGKGK
jgi:N-methylhydantoinase A